jgi:hypothetical protein
VNTVTADLGSSLSLNVIMGGQDKGRRGGGVRRKGREERKEGGSGEREGRDRGGGGKI